MMSKAQCFAMRLQIELAVYTRVGSYRKSMFF